MNFSFTEEQTTIRDLARQILASEATSERVKAAEATSDWRDAALWTQLAEANLLGIAIAEEHGGMGMGFAELCMLLHEAGRAVAPGPWLATLVLAALPIAEFGTPEQKRALLPRIARGELLATLALDDAHSAELAAPATRGVASGDLYVLDGAKRSVPFARSAGALLIPARTQDGVAIFALEPSADGVCLTPSAISTGEPLFDLTLSGVRVPAAARLGGASADGARVLRWLEPRALTAVAALQVGVSERALQITADYTKQRIQFGVPIGSFQAAQHRQADGFIALEAMRWTSWRAACRIAEGLPALREARVAKFWAADGGSRVANASLHLHGGLGSDVDYPIHRHFLWSKALELTLGGATPTLAALGRDLAATGPEENA